MFIQWFFFFEGATFIEVMFLTVREFPQYGNKRHMKTRLCKIPYLRYVASLRQTARALCSLTLFRFLFYPQPERILPSTIPKLCQQNILRRQILVLEEKYEPKNLKKTKNYERFLHYTHKPYSILLFQHNCVTHNLNQNSVQILMSTK